MNAGRMRGMRRALVGWMRPSVAKVGAVQVGTGVIAVGALFTGVEWHWWAVSALGYFFYACVGHSVGYHRYFAHRSFPAPRWAEVMFTVAGTLGCVGSPVGWAHTPANIIFTRTTTATRTPRTGTGIRRRGRC